MERVILRTTMNERCEICGCVLTRGSEYAKPTVAGRSGATRHHQVAERFFGRSGNRRGTVRDPIFGTCPWGAEGKQTILCYECHEELLHNPVFLAEDIARFAEIVKARGLDEIKKTESRARIAGRIKLLHETIEAGMKHLALQHKTGSPHPRGSDKVRPKRVPNKSDP